MINSNKSDLNIRKRYNSSNKHKKCQSVVLEFPKKNKKIKKSLSILSNQGKNKEKNGTHNIVVKC